jgi:hypothetical protein
MGPSLPPLVLAIGLGGRAGDLDLQRCRLVIHLEGGVIDVEALLEQLLKRTA